jgi:hypothetical protein
MRSFCAPRPIRRFSLQLALVDLRVAAKDD